MRRMFARFVALAAVVAVCGVAQAAPVIVAEDGGKNDAGNTITNFYVETEDGVGSMAVELSFTLENGTYVDVQGGLPSGPVNKKSGAVSAQQIAEALGGAYRQNNDTWYDDSMWTAENPGNNPHTGTVTNGVWTDGGAGEKLFVALGSERNSGNRVSVLQMVTTGTVINWSGIIAQAGANNQVSGSYDTVPEPAAVTMALFGLLGLVRVIRRK